MALSAGCSDQLSNCVQFSVEKSGGPPEITDYTLWKKYLAANKQSWAVIDRGSNLTPIWEIILSAHADDFSDHFQLCEFLRNAYDTITHQHVECGGGDEVLQVRREAEKMMALVDDWSVTCPEQHLHELLKIKRQIREKTSSYRAWTEICLTNKGLQKLLFKITATHSEGNLKVMMQSVMAGSHSVKDFPNRDTILKWMQVENVPRETETEETVRHMSDLEQVLKNERDHLQNSQSTDARKSATCRVTTAVNSFCKALDKDSQDELVMLLKTICQLVGYQGETFCPILGLKETEFLLNTLPEVHNKYSALRNQSLLKGNAYALLTMLTVSYKEHDCDEKERLQSYLSLQEEISADIRVAINECLPNNNWIQLRKKMMSLTGETTEDNMLLLQETPVTPQISSEIAPCDKQHFSSSSEITTEPSEPIKNLILKMGLLEKTKITVPEVLSITTLSLNENELQTDTELWVYFINKLMILDVNCRYVTCEHAQKEHMITDVNEDDFFNFQMESTENVNDEENHIHPMDVYMAVFHCTDDLSREHIINKLSTCQFALPLLVPNPFNPGQIEVPVSALPQIKKTWISRGQSGTVDNIEPKSGSLFSIPVPVVSFIRIGMSGISKSQIMNYILNQNRHPTFYNRGCSGSTKTCLLLDGVAEMFWYCPSGRQDDHFQNCVAFINLHGDANKHPIQLQLIEEMSSVIVLLLPENPRQPEIQELITKLKVKQIPLIFLFSGVEHRSPTTDNRIAAKNRNEAELKREIISKVTQVLHKKKNMHSIERHVVNAKERGLIAYKECQEVRSGQEKANNLMAILKKDTKENNEDLLKLKNKFLPLQDELWSEWSKYDKEFYRLQSSREKSISQKLTEITLEKNRIREKQMKELQSLNEFMTQFFKYALHRDESTERIVMLNWLGKYLAELYTDILTSLNDQYHKTWTDIRKHKADDENLLQVISGKIKSATFGIHHIMRETAQIYEAMHEFKKSSTTGGIDLERLPELGAEMMLSGCPIELLDGDVNHIPLNWISAVLDKLIQKTGDKRVFVLSVLGLQSSGKSTLLNAMFGLQFSVSAGRCTKGAFMQLVPVEEQLRDELQFDFILVVDTEGLRSVEAASISHDNELATLVVGLADVSIINIMGENPSEIQDTLQICFQAFLRMISVDIKPFCFFVHQNVAETDAKNKTQECRRQLMSKLDEISKTVAEAEDKEVSGFNDIIQFDAETQVFYFQNYFDGNPPMAHPNPSYSQNVQELKIKLLSIAKWQPNCKLPLLSEFRERIQNLWNALLKENFVFHFQNSLHIMVYNKLEEEYGKWSWKMRKHALETQNSLHYMISSNESYETQTGQFKHDFDRIYQDSKGDVDKYFREEKHPEILIQWKDNTEKRLESLKKELIEETSAKEQELLKMKKFRLALDQRRIQYEVDLLQKSKDLASQLKTEKPNEEELKTRFNAMWTTWETEVASEKPQKESINIQAVVENILQYSFRKYWDRIDHTKDVIQFNVETHVKHSWRETFSRWKSSKNQEAEAGNLLSQRIQDVINKILTKTENANVAFSDNLIYQLLGEIKTTIESCENECSIKFKDLYKAEVAVCELNKAVKKLKLLNENFTRKNDPLFSLNSKKEEFFKLFKHFCEGATSVTFFVHYLVNYLMPVVQDAVNDKLGIEIVQDLKSNYPPFSGTRSKLEQYILKDLAEKEDFELYKDYMFKPQKLFRNFITEHTNNYLTDGTKLPRKISAIWSSFNDQIIFASNCATNHIVEKQGKGNASEWLDEFCENLGSYMAISRMDLKSIEKEEIQDPEFLKNHFAQSLKEATETASEKHKESFQSGPALFKFTNRPDYILFKQLSGCWEQCPFCKAVCTNTIPDHDTDHTVQMHRPIALGNLVYREIYFFSIFFTLFSGFKWRPLFQSVNEFGLKFCTEAVKSNAKFCPQEEWIQFSEYRKAGPPYDRWGIGDYCSDELYWKWFICTFRAKLEELLGGKFQGYGEIPKEWEKITKTDALKELKGASLRQGDSRASETQEQNCLEFGSPVVVTSSQWVRQQMGHLCVNINEFKWTRSGHYHSREYGLYCLGHKRWKKKKCGARFTITEANPVSCTTIHRHPSDGWSDGEVAKV
ncbi:hypothetical protein NFI96_002179 [Prochilodus magdalenae]|nr:hypothetical protein NFI96_002179 [Prochilodus magdalenae]